MLIVLRAFSVLGEDSVDIWKTYLTSVSDKVVVLNTFGVLKAGILRAFLSICFDVFR